MHTHKRPLLTPHDHHHGHPQIDAFAAGFWPGPIYFDVDKAFYKALNGGQVLRGSMLGLTWPWSAAWKRINAASKWVPPRAVCACTCVWGEQGGGGAAVAAKPLYMHG